MASIQDPEKTSPPTVSAQEQKMLQAVRDMVRTCIQCGTCSASCPNEFAMDYTPRQLWRMVMMDNLDDILATKTFALCSSCYLCTLRCPRGLQLTDAMAALKQAATMLKVKEYRPSQLFYEQFLNSVRRHGRVQEMELMALYFAHRKNPRLPLRFASMGIKLIAKGKIALPKPGRGPRNLEALFDKAAAMEKGDAQ